MNNGFGEALSRAFELALTPIIFAFFGWLLDKRFGTFPLITLPFFLFVVAYGFWKQYRTYDATMKHEEAKMMGRAPKGDGR
jgi:F0F1-type ATP synthase assembly protein I